MTVTEALQNSTIFAYLLPLVSAILLTQLLMPLVVRLAQRLGAVDHPNERKVHVNATPRMGGLAFFFSIFLIPFTLLDIHAATQGFLLGLVIITCTGIADDIFDISPKLKLLGVLAGTGFFLVMSGVEVVNLGDLIATGNIETGWFAIPLTLIGMVGFINALNLSDGLDGLAAGICLIVSFFLGCFAFIIGDQDSLMIAIVLFGAMIGFLYFNSHPAKVFMGDTGSLILGFVLSGLSLILIKSGEGAVVSPISMGILLGLPLSDTLYVMTRRIIRGTSPFEADKTHFHHRLIDLGLTHTEVVGVFYGLVFLYGCTAVFFSGSLEWVQSLALLVLIAGSYVPLILLERAGFSFATPAQTSESEPSADNETSFFYFMTHHLGRSIPLVTWGFPLLLLLPVLSIKHSQEYVFLMATVMILVALLYPWKGNRDATWSQGLLYLLVFVLLLAINLSEQLWVENYMFVLTSLLACWVILKLWFKRHLRVFLTTGLESLLLVFSWIAPWVTGHFNLLPSDLQQTLYVVCWQAVIFLLTTKIVLRRQPRRNKQLLISLLVLAGISFI